MSQKDRLLVLVSNWWNGGRPPVGLLEELELFVYQAQARESIQCEKIAQHSGQSELAGQIKDTFPEGIH